MSNEFVRINKKALVELLLNSYKTGFKDAMRTLEAVDVENMFNKEEVEELTKKLLD